MRIGVYNRYWNTRGGGERYAGAMAEILSRHHEVELIGPEPISLTGLAKHLGLDLSRSHFRQLPRVSERELVPVTSEYDLFVNCTYLSRLRSRAKNSVYVVLFPQRTWPPGLLRAARGVADAVDRTVNPQVEPLAGFHEVDAKGSRWSREFARLRIHPWAFRANQARVPLLPPRPWRLEEAIIDVRAPGLAWHIDKEELVLVRPEGSSDEPVDIEVACKTFVPAELGLSTDERQLGVCLVRRRASRIAARFQPLLRKVEGRLDGHDAEIPTSYDLLLAISHFTQHWISERWRQPSEILTPPVDTATFAAPDPSEKRKIILSVGRFFFGSHNKKHLQMLRVFRRMIDRRQIPEGWEYHLVGNLHRDRRVDVDYFTDLKRLADGYPVKILVDLELDRLIDEYRHASIFWHAAGWGESERRQPEKFEHFGLTTCEAMSAGCIPVVIAKAGQLETVDHGQTGFLFSSARDLSRHTQRLVEGYGQPWTHAMMQRASAAMERFSRPQFERRLLEIFKTRGLLP